ncbi:response regulator transcription factor [Pseudonocardia acidicola]|uniref:Response regulator transcription factor n=1 Tax=Pseudonocardia acidicola TaxID=2724939 RepID=A0ABX1SI00_9PSEU|nr:response regulator transcription factor [Pseudonocardia acidicola]NMI00560.1 response regulator transcription factor [Pseudonocardia acidicola]
MTAWTSDTERPHLDCEDGRLSAVLVDDHEIVLEGLERALSREAIDVVAAFRDDASTLRFLGDGSRTAAQVDLAVVDLRLGGRSGVDLVKEILRVRPDIQIAMLTSFEDRAAAMAAVRAGARGFFLKDSLCGELCAGLRRVADGHLVIDARLAAAVLHKEPNQFTIRELAILRLVAEGLSNRQIGDELHLSRYTVKEYLSRTMRKLGTGTRAETVLRAAREGLLPRDQ